MPKTKVKADVKESTANLEALKISLRALAEQMKAAHQAYAKHLPTTDPNMYWHTVDCNLHTTVGARFSRDEVQTLELKDETRVQYLSSKPELCFFIDISKKKSGKISYLYLDCVLLQKEAATYRSLDDLLRALEERRAGNEARPNRDEAPRALTSTLPPEQALTVEKSREILASMSAAAKSTRSKVAVSVGPRDKLQLRTRDEASRELSALELQKALRTLLDGDKEREVVQFLRTNIDAQALDEFVAPMAQSWADAEQKGAANRWLLLAAGELGGEKSAAILGRFCAAQRENSKAHATITAALDGLSRMGTPWAAHEIYAVATLPSRYTKRRNEAKALFERVAGRAKISVEDLLSQAIPRDASEIDRARIVAVQSRRLERMMVDGKRLPFARFRVEFLEHPLLATLCERTIFGVFAADSLQQSFRLDGKKLIDGLGKAIVIDPAAQIGVAHPVELELGNVLVAWRATSIPTQPFAQLQRPMRSLNDRQAKANAIYDFKNYRRDWLHEQEWWGYKVDSDYMADADTFAVMMERDGKYIEAKLDGAGKIFVIGMGKVEMDWNLKAKNYVATPSDATPFGKLHRVSQNELLYALFGGTAPSTIRAAAAAPTVAKSSGSGRYPYAEKAKSSRSLCLFCEKKIDKDTVRVVVEREIKSDAFNGMGPGYLHADCARTYPDLAAMPDLDAVIRKNSEIEWP